MHVQGVIKAVSFVVVVVVDTKIAESGDLDTQGSCTCNESVEFGKKLVSLCLELIVMAYRLHKLYLFVGHNSHAH